MNLENDIRPIAITCPIAKVAEQFTSRFFNERFTEYIDSAQFGSTATSGILQI